MTKVFLMLTVAGVALAGCAPIIYGESRKVIREAITPAIAAARPDVPQEAGSACIVKGMTAVEVLSMPNSPTVRDSAAMGVFVAEVMQRPGVGACLDAAATA